MISTLHSSFQILLIMFNFQFKRHLYSEKHIKQRSLLSLSFNVHLLPKFQNILYWNISYYLYLADLQSFKYSIFANSCRIILLNTEWHFCQVRNKEHICDLFTRKFDFHGVKTSFKSTLCILHGNTSKTKILCLWKCSSEKHGMRWYKRNEVKSLSLIKRKKKGWSTAPCIDTTRMSFKTPPL